MIKYERKRMWTVPSSGDPLFDLWVLMRRAYHAFFKARQRELGQYGLSSQKSAVLFLAQHLDNKSTPAEIARHMILEAHSVSALLSRMEEEGLVLKVKDLPRKNMTRIVLTETGRQAYDQTKIRESIHRILSVLSEEEREQLESFLKRIRDRALKEI